MPIITDHGKVAPLAGAWIEIIRGLDYWAMCDVAPLAGAWIEIVKLVKRNVTCKVAPLAGAWIEIKDTSSILDII